MRRRCRTPPLLALSAATVLVIAGCADEDEQATNQSVVVSPEPSPTASPVSPQPDTDRPEAADADTSDSDGTSAPLDERPPELDLVGDDYEQVVRNHTAYTTWLLRHPDPERFDDVTHPDCECYIQKELLTHYQREGLRWTGEGPGIQVLDVAIVDDQARNMIHLQVVFQRTQGSTLVDSDGTVRDEVEPRDPWVEDLVFVREHASAPWKLRDFVDRGSLNGDNDA